MAWLSTSESGSGFLVQVLLAHAFQLLEQGSPLFERHLQAQVYFAPGRLSLEDLFEGRDGAIKVRNFGLDRREALGPDIGHAVLHAPSPRAREAPSRGAGCHARSAPRLRAREASGSMILFA